jgi:hypothetical protein
MKRDRKSQVYLQEHEENNNLDLLVSSADALSLKRNLAVFQRANVPPFSTDKYAEHHELQPQMQKNGCIYGTPNSRQIFLRLTPDDNPLLWNARRKPGFETRKRRHRCEQNGG